MPPLAATVVLLTVLLQAAAVFMVGRARGRFGVKAPATTGHPDFERVFRAQMNTIEHAVMFLPAFAVALLYGHDLLACGLGLAWLLFRTWYLVAYAGGGSRALPFALSGVALVALLVQGIWGLAWTWALA